MPENNTFNRNIGYGNGEWIRESLTGNVSLINHRVVRVLNLPNSDPGFVDESLLDLTLRSDSPAYGMPLFQPIPFSSIGRKLQGKDAFLSLDGTQAEWALQSYRDAWLRNLVDMRLMSQAKKSINREEFAELLVTLYEVKTGKISAIAENPFTDTTNPVVVRAYQIGLAKGTSVNRFSPDLPVSRQDAAVMIQNVMLLIHGVDAGQVGTDPSFTDSQDISSYAVEAVRYVKHSGLMIGMGNNRFLPKGNVSREQAIRIIVNMYNH
jgi:hypothetical protein